MTNLRCKPASGRSWFYAVVAAIGLIVPNVMLAIYFSRPGSSTSQYFRDWFGSVPASQIALDLLIAGIAFLVWSRWEARRIGITLWWVVVPATFLVGFCFAVPLFLFMREQHTIGTA